MGGMRHLTEQQAIGALRRGASLEQMLTPALDGSGTIRWLQAIPSGIGITLRIHHDYDDGRDDFLDVYEFRSVDEDDYLGAGSIVGEYPDAATLLSAASELGATAERWVNEGIIQDEYGDLRNR